MSSLFLPRIRTHRAFSLIEVVVAVGLFAVGIVAAIGLFAPVAKSVSDSSDAEAAIRAAEILVAKLRGAPFDTVPAQLKTSADLTRDSINPRYNPTTDKLVYAASLDGSKIALVSDSSSVAWPNGNRDKYFELTLVRNETLSPAVGDASASYLAFAVRVRWPLYVPAGPNVGRASLATLVGATNPAAAVPFDQGQKQVLFLTGSVTR